ncbi:MAG: tRNA (adenosine(37)-N6)-dimethylallyltransferase MiaA [Ignavibacteria bacterium]|nr:tRNA (adenosine(37)-N6)-dimethylallyltransferase MiaA [Ignavibacteria bacterium]
MAIVGATASGKTSVSLELARILNCEIISADSRQIYQYLDIGTAKPSQLELERCIHHFINILTPDIDYSAGKFAVEATNTIHQLISNQKVPLIVGGSGLYVRALCEGIFSEPTSEDSSEIRNQLESRLQLLGKQLLYEELQRVDRLSAEKYADKNPRRIIRALEFYYSTGIPFSQAQHENKTSEIPFRTLYFGIEHSREDLYNRINVRCEDMWRDGLVQETESILATGYSPTLNSLNTVGYKEAIQYLSGKISEKEALAAMQQSTRNYAKRQLTWCRKMDQIQWLGGSSVEIAEMIAEHFTQLQSKDL